jgi:nucleoside-diphosphate-sugar epimerase
MERVLITGASGFIGRCCLPGIAARAGLVHAVSRSGLPGFPAPVRAHAVDLLDARAAAGLVAEVRPTHLLHLAWFAKHGQFWASPENLRWVEASLNLLRAFAAHGGRRVVIAGSCAEYDWTGDGHCREGVTPLRPASLYGVCKDALRAVSEAYARTAGLSLAWGRVFFLYGPGEHPDRLVPSVIRSLLAGEPARCSDGTQRRDYLHVQDVAEAFVALLASDVTGPVNIGSGEGVPVAAIVRQIGASLKRPDLIRLGGLPARAGDPPLIEADTRRLREEVGWRPRLDLERGLTDAIRWWTDSNRHEKH